MKIQNEKIQNEKIQNEKVQNEKIQNEKIQNKIINISAQRQRFRLVVCVVVYVLNEPVQTFNVLWSVARARRHRFFYAKLYRRMAVYGQND